MKKIIFAALITMGSFTFADDVGVITLSGSIGVINEIVITQNEIATNLNIAEGEDAALVATVEESSNSPTGYTIYMNSVNNSNLINTENDAESVSYTIAYDGAAPVALSTSDLAVKTVGALGGLVTDESEVVLALVGDSTVGSGNYTDTITVSIAAN